MPFFPFTILIKLFIPTFNRSYKLARVLRAYSLWQDPPEIYVLDGSDDSFHAEANQKISSSYDFVRYSHKILPLHERYCIFADSCDNEDIFFMANDEDVYLEAFCNLSFRMMGESDSLSSVVGSCVTIWPPLISSVIPRISLKKLIPRAFVLTGSPLQKISMHIALNQSTKLPPLYYSPQRISHFKEFLVLLRNSQIKNSSAELLHQFNLLSKGDVYFIPNLMLLRDETRINYQIEPDRQGDSSYIEPQEVEKVFDMTFGRTSDLSAYLNCIFSPPLTLASGVLAADDFVSSYLTPITQMVYSDNPLIRSFYRASQALFIRVLSSLNAIAVLLLSPIFARSARYFLIRSLLMPISVNARSSSRV